MSTFSTRGGLYEKAQKEYKLQNGKLLFTYSFFDKRRKDATAFFADIWVEAQSAKPSPGHLALATLASKGLLRRHYTLNIDGLAEAAGMDTWHHEENPEGITVEMHGNIHHLVCAECHATAPVTSTVAEKLKNKEDIICAACTENSSGMRFKVMLYDDAESLCITPDEVLDLLEDDVRIADLILWIGISFEQSASISYFRRVRRTLAEEGRLAIVPQALINPSEEVLWNLLTALSNLPELSVIEINETSNDVLMALVEKL